MPTAGWSSQTEKIIPKKLASRVESSPEIEVSELEVFAFSSHTRSLGVSGAANILLVVGQNFFCISDRSKKIARQADQGSAGATKNNHQAHPRARAGTKVVAEPVRKQRIALHSRFQDKIGQQASQNRRNRLGQPGDQAPGGENPSL